MKTKKNRIAFAAICAGLLGVAVMPSVMADEVVTKSCDSLGNVTTTIESPAVIERKTTFDTLNGAETMILPLPAAETTTTVEKVIERPAVIKETTQPVLMQEPMLIQQPLVVKEGHHLLRFSLF
jgi:hypothetical protein